MTPKEKAEALVDRLYGCAEINRSEAKQCALIAVDEVINEYESNICNSGYDYDFERWDMQRDYWIEVKYEIDNIKN